MHPIIVDSDNALGSARGDVDDAFAIAALLAAKAPVAALTAVFGNAPVDEVESNHHALATAFGTPLTVARGAACAGDRATPASRAIGASSANILAIGPLTNVAGAITLDGEFARRSPGIVCVGGNASSSGRWPPIWPFEFNFTHDAAALVDVIASPIPVTIVPLDVARRLRVGLADVEALPGPRGLWLAERARRWWTRARRRYLSRTVPVWDLAAAAFLLAPEHFDVASRVARAHANGWLEIRAGGEGRPIRVVTAFDPREAWDAFARSLLP